jgi:hypothetical protein
MQLLNTFTNAFKKLNEPATTETEQKSEEAAAGEAPQEREGDATEEVEAEKKKIREEVFANPENEEFVKQFTEFESRKETLVKELNSMESERAAYYKEFFNLLIDKNTSQDVDIDKDLNLLDHIGSNDKIKEINSKFQQYKELGEFYRDVLGNPLFASLIKVSTINPDKTYPAYYYTADKILYFDKTPPAAEDNTQHVGIEVDVNTMYLLEYKKQFNKQQEELLKEQEKVEQEKIEKEEEEAQEEKVAEAEAEKESRENIMADEIKKKEESERQETIEEKVKELKEEVSEANAQNMLNEAAPQAEQQAEQLPQAEQQPQAEQLPPPAGDQQ